MLLSLRSKANDRAVPVGMSWPQPCDRRVLVIAVLAHAGSGSEAPAWRRVGVVGGGACGGTSTAAPPRALPVQHQSLFPRRGTSWPNGQLEGLGLAIV